MTFDSHVFNLVDVAARLVNELTPGLRGGMEVEVPRGAERAAATARALGGEGRATPHVTDRQANALAAHAAQLRKVFQAAHDDDMVEAARILNRLLRRTGARPQLDPLAHGGYHVHFHGTTDGLATGWGAGCATGLALAIGTDLAGRLGVCAAERCDRVYVDTSKNGTRRFCSTTCQNRTKTAAFRRRSADQVAEPE
jgi:predicted RNA-binding Zn ribbon-like protein